MVSICATPWVKSVASSSFVPNLRWNSRYASATGAGPAHPYWDLLTLVEILPEPDVYRGWTQLGLGGLSVALLRARLDEYVALVVSRL